MDAETDPTLRTAVVLELEHPLSDRLNIVEQELVDHFRI